MDWLLGCQFYYPNICKQQSVSWNGGAYQQISTSGKYLKMFIDWLISYSFLEFGFNLVVIDIWDNFA